MRRRVIAHQRLKRAFAKPRRQLNLFARQRRPPHNQIRRRLQRGPQGGHHPNLRTRRHRPIRHRLIHAQHRHADQFRARFHGRPDGGTRHHDVIRPRQLGGFQIRRHPPRDHRRQAAAADNAFYQAVVRDVKDIHTGQQFLAQRAKHRHQRGRGMHQTEGFLFHHFNFPLFKIPK